MATLGSRSSHSKVQKKDIVSVSIPETCTAISQPPQPLALRASSSLLYGVALVYKHKMNYFYSEYLRAVSLTKRRRVLRKVHTV